MVKRYRKSFAQMAIETGDPEYGNKVLAKKYKTMQENKLKKLALIKQEINDNKSLETLYEEEKLKNIKQESKEIKKEHIIIIDDDLNTHKENTHKDNSHNNTLPAEIIVTRYVNNTSLLPNINISSNKIESETNAIKELIDIPSFEEIINKNKKIQYINRSIDIFNRNLKLFLKFITDNFTTIYDYRTKKLAYKLPTKLSDYNINYKQINNHFIKTNKDMRIRFHKNTPYLLFN